MRYLFASLPPPVLLLLVSGHLPVCRLSVIQYVSTPCRGRVGGLTAQG